MQRSVVVQHAEFPADRRAGVLTTTGADTELEEQDIAFVRHSSICSTRAVIWRSSFVDSGTDVAKCDDGWMPEAGHDVEAIFSMVLISMSWRRRAAYP